MDKQEAVSPLCTAAIYLAGAFRDRIQAETTWKVEKSPYDTDGCYVAVGRVVGVAPELCITVWVENSIDSKESIFWAGFAPADVNQATRLYQLCPPKFNQCIKGWEWKESNGLSYLAPASWKERKGLSGSAVCELPAAEVPSFGVYSASLGNQDLKLVAEFIGAVLDALRESGGVDLCAEIEAIEKNSLTETEKDAQVKVRIGQGKFRKALDKLWDGKCAILGLQTREVLRASHIKPWRESSSEERMDPHNGLLLSAHLDALFDRYLISFDEQGEILFSNALHREVLTFNLNGAKLRGRLSKKQYGYLECHRNQFRSATANAVPDSFETAL